MEKTDDTTLQTWLDALQGLDLRVKKMFGCWCVYCDGQVVGWIDGGTFSLKEVGLSSIPDTLRRPGPGDKIKEIPVPLEEARSDWFREAVLQTAKARKKGEK